MSHRVVVTAKLYAADSTTLIVGALDNATGIVFMRELNGCGLGSLSLGLGDANASQLVRGRYVGVFLDGTRKFTWKIEGSPKYDQIDDGEEIAQVLTIEGRGWACLWEEFQIYPDGGLGVPPLLDYNYRLFSFASRTFPNIIGWAAAQEMYEYKDGVAYAARVDSVVDTGTDPDDPADDVVKLYPAPIGYPWPNAEKNGNGFAPTPTYEPTYWVLADGAPDEESLGFHFFRGSFTLAGAQQCKFTITGDNLFNLYVNGVPILGEADDTLVWRGWKEVTLTLPAGEYVVAAVIENVDADVDYNPAGLLMNVIAMEVYPGDVQTTETLALLSSSAADFPDSFYSASTWPGYSTSQILDVIGDEGQARGSAPQYVDGTFTEFADSNGNDWDTLDPDTTLEFIPSFETKLSNTGLDVLNQLHEEGWMDWEFSGDVCELNAYTPGSLGGASVATYTQGVNIRGLERGEGKPYVNALLIQWSDGFTEAVDAAAVTAAGARIEGFLSTQATTAEDGQRLGRVELVRRAVEVNPAVLLSVEPASSTDCPLDGVNLGDFVTIPGVFSGTEDVQVLAITCTQDAEGFASWALELNARWRSPEQERRDLMRTIGGKTMGSLQDRGVVAD